MGEADHRAGSGKADFAVDRRGCAGDTPMQVATRELHGQTRDPRFWIGTVAVVAILAVAAPFGTDEALGPMGLLGYWGVIAVATYLPCAAVIAFSAALLARLGLPSILAHIAGALLGGMAVFVIVGAVNALAGFGAPADPLALLARCVLIAVAVDAIAVVARRPRTAEEPCATPGDGAEADVQDPSSHPVLSRLPAGRHGEIVRMATQDHYVEVVTTRSRDLVLMRMADAVAAMGSAGVQTHRSHWVALGRVTGNERRNGRWHLRMSDGALVPVSRTHRDAVRDAGLLPTMHENPKGT